MENSLQLYQKIFSGMPSTTNHMHLTYIICSCTVVILNLNDNILCLGILLDLVHRNARDNVRTAGIGVLEGALLLR